MRDFEFQLQKWLLAIAVLIAIVVVAMNHWYRVLPARAAREAAAAAVHADTAHTQTRDASPAQAAAATPAIPRTALPPPQTREQDLDMPVLTFANGRTLGFAKSVTRESHDWPATDVIHPWLMTAEEDQRDSLPPIPSRRDQFTPILLDDGRLALIGGRTPRDMVALDKQCADCPDEYMPFGEATASSTTDVFDFESSTWSQGPTAAKPANTVIRLRDGRIFKVALETAGANDEQSTTRLHIETADSQFTRWESAGEASSDGWFSQAQVFESRSGAVVLLEGNGGVRAYHWKARGKVDPWLDGETWAKVEQLDEGHLQLTQNLDVYPPRSTMRIVELP